MNSKIRKSILLAIAPAIFLSSCTVTDVATTLQNPKKSAVNGAALGALGGAIAGHGKNRRTQQRYTALGTGLGGLGGWGLSEGYNSGLNNQQSSNAARQTGNTSGPFTNKN